MMSDIIYILPTAIWTFSIDWEESGIWKGIIRIFIFMGRSRGLWSIVVLDPFGGRGIARQSGRRLFL